VWLPKAGQQRTTQARERERAWRRTTQAGVAAYAVRGDLNGRGRRTFRERASLVMRAVEARAAGPEGNLPRRSRGAGHCQRRVTAPGHGGHGAGHGANHDYHCAGHSEHGGRERLAGPESAAATATGAAAFTIPSEGLVGRNIPNHSKSNGVRGPRRMPTTIDEADIAMLVR
jgi:hypothetical protein